MVNIRKSLSLVISLFVLLSNIAFAQYSDPGQYEGRPIDPSREGIDYYREGEVIVYPSNSGPGNMDGNFNEEEMRRLMKEKYGDKFSEEAFNKRIIEMRGREQRKESFSYENEGYENRYYEGPSYEGYSKESMIFSMVFEHIGNDIDPREIKQYCSEPEKIADMVILKFKEKVGDLQSVCSKIAEKEKNCLENSKKSCEQAGKPYVKEGANELEKISALAYACPLNREKILEACKKRSEYYTGQRMQNMGRECEERFNSDGEKRVRECEQFRQNSVCEKEKYMMQCTGPETKDVPESRDKLFSSARWECYDGTIESQTDVSCKSHSFWSESARKTCEGRCSKESGKCGVNSLSVSGECGNEMSSCPKYPVPNCEQGNVVREKRDSNNCVYHYCEAEIRECTKE